jgi:hypothetical protein
LSRLCHRYAYGQNKAIGKFEGRRLDLKRVVDEAEIPDDPFSDFMYIVRKWACFKAEKSGLGVIIGANVGILLIFLETL